MNETPEWTSTEYLAGIAADELSTAMQRVGVLFLGCGTDEGGDVTVVFHDLADAATLMTLAVISDDIPGGLYDRATSGCISLTLLADELGEPTAEQQRAILERSWTWTIHPAMNLRRMGWHVSLTVPMADANQITANLNALRLGGAV